MRSLHHKRRDRLLLWIAVTREADSLAVALVGGDEGTEPGGVLWDRFWQGCRVVDLKGSDLRCHRRVARRELLHVIGEDNRGRQDLLLETERRFAEDRAIGREDEDGFESCGYHSRDDQRR